MGLILNALPDVRSQMESLQRTLGEKSQRIEMLEAELRQEKAKTATYEMAVGELRNTLSPLYHALQITFGHIDAVSVRESGATAVSGAKRDVWESWKQKLGGSTGKAIDVLFLHGPMNQTQLRIQLSCATRTVTNIVAALNRAGLINKVDGKIALKEL